MAVRRAPRHPARPGPLHLRLCAGLIPGSAAAAQIEDSLAAQGAPNATVACPQNIIVKLGTTVTCDVSGAQGVAQGTVTFTFSEANGTVDACSLKAA